MFQCIWLMGSHFEDGLMSVCVEVTDRYGVMTVHYWLPLWLIIGKIANNMKIVLAYINLYTIRPQPESAQKGTVLQAVYEGVFIIYLDVLSSKLLYLDLRQKSAHYFHPVSSWHLTGLPLAFSEIVVPSQFGLLCWRLYFDRYNYNITEAFYQSQGPHLIQCADERDQCNWTFLIPIAINLLKLNIIMYCLIVF